jgi:hypothetical protein
VITYNLNEMNNDNGLKDKNIASLRKREYWKINKMMAWPGLRRYERRRNRPLILIIQVQEGSRYNDNDDGGGDAYVSLLHQTLHTHIHGIIS